jgi:hypothetical protein
MHMAFLKHGTGPSIALVTLMYLKHLDHLQQAPLDKLRHQGNQQLEEG